jgi:choline dehydrogenase
MPTALTSAAMDDFIRDGVTTIWHQSCTAKMGQDDMSVVDGRLEVYGVDRLRIADASVMPRVPLGNTMAPSVIIGEQASRAIARDAGFDPFKFPERYFDETYNLLKAGGI